MATAIQRYSNRFIEAGEALAHRGAFFQEEANNRGLALVEAIHDGTKLFFLVDVEDERIVEARYFTHGGAGSMAVAESVCSLVERGPVDFLFRLTGEAVEHSLRDVFDVPAAPAVLFDSIRHLAHSAKENWEPAKIVWAASQFIRARRAEEPVAVAPERWLQLNPNEQRRQVDQALDGRIRSFLQADGGDIEVLSVADNNRVEVRFTGMCGSCGSATGSTLSAVEEWLREKVYSHISVVPV